MLKEQRILNHSDRGYGFSPFPYRKEWDAPLLICDNVLDFHPKDFFPYQASPPSTSQVLLEWNRWLGWSLAQKVA